jgi:lipopolysaccharide/colanic/teichoic acid biosynthesis glycosyltransferase
MSKTDKIIKRVFDIVLSIVGIIVTWWIMLIAWIVATIETKSNGLFVQKRIGKDAKEFDVYKIKTMKPSSNTSTVTTANDSRITKSGAFFRRTKIDELPQLFNVLFGSMSFVGPRPDVAGFADELEGDDRIILSIRPGITSPASIKYKNEEEILANVDNPIEYNKNVIWRDKVKINKEYIKNYSLKNDILYIIKTIIG